MSEVGTSVPGPLPEARHPEVGVPDADGLYLTESVCKVVLQKSILAQIHQLILYTSNSKG